MKITVLGAGLVGAPMAMDLAQDPKLKICSVDVDTDSLNKFKKFPIEPIQSDLSNTENVKKVIKGSNYIINALPGFMGYSTLKTIIEESKNVVDISFFNEDPFELDSLAKEKNVTAAVDCGVAPGLSNLLVGNITSKLDRTDNVLIYVGGLPKVREWPYEYKAVFSPADVIEEYTRPARYIENGKLITRPALSDSEYLFFSSLGTIEAFNSDGLRTLANTIQATNMKEKTLRYPGHIEKMAMLRESGFFSKEKIKINGCETTPLEVTSKILFPNWHLKKEDRDITVMKIIIEGMIQHRMVNYVYTLFDNYDEVTHTHSMARTTGYTGTAVLRLLVNGIYRETGIKPLELIGKEKESVNYILNELEKRNVVIHQDIKYS